MALLPISLQHEIDDLLRMPTHHFGLGMSPMELYRPLGMVHHLQQEAEKQLKTRVDANGDFKVSINVKEFAPEELKITTEGNMIVVEGKHEEKTDHDGLIWRHFVRKYLVPEGHHLEMSQSNLSKHGILTITAPKKDAIKPGPISIPITHLGSQNGKSIEEK